MQLVDTSVWIEVFRKDTRFRLEDVVELDEIATCLPIIQEVLQGFRDERAFHTARDSMYAFPLVDSPMSADVFDHAIQLYRRTRRAGITVRSSINCLIAACAERAGLTVVHCDRDYDAIAKVSQLNVRRVSV